MNQNQRLGSLVEHYRTHFGDTADAVYDCGTRDGHDAYYLATELNAKTVVAIDANPLAVIQTKKNYPDFKVYELALSNHVGTSQFTQIVSEREDYAGSSSLVNYNTFPGATYNIIEVQVDRMDNLIEREGLDSFDLMKVDLEGFTYEFLEGMGKYLSSVKVFHLETEKFDRHSGHKNADAVKELMSDAGFDLVECSYEWGPHIEDQVWVNTTLL